MMLKWTLFTLLLYEALDITSPSIAGVTYRDNFDFEKRYRNVNECNPFYWHPLHLPEMCADMYERIIRSRLLKRKLVPKEMESNGHTYSYSPNHFPGYAMGAQMRDLPYPIYEIGSTENDDEDKDDSYAYSKSLQMTPYEIMLEMLKKDIKKDPSQPSIGVLPDLGPVAIYNQEISKKSKDMIKDVATTYAKYVQDQYAEIYGYNAMPDHQMYVWDSHKNQTKLQLRNKHNKKKKKQKDDRISRTKSKYGDIITIVETLSPRKRSRRSALYMLGL